MNAEAVGEVRRRGANFLMNRPRAIAQASPCGQTSPSPPAAQCRCEQFPLAKESD
jgi:hypothetical protein